MEEGAPARPGTQVALQARLQDVGGEDFFIQCQSLRSTVRGSPGETSKTTRSAASYCSFRYEHVYKFRISKIPIITFITVCFCSAAVAMYSGVEIKTTTVGFMLTSHFPEELIELIGGGCHLRISKERFIGYAMGYYIHIFRTARLMAFISATNVLIGTSDGPLNILLNSVCLTFVMDMTGALQERQAPEATVFGPVIDTDEVEEHPEDITYENMAMAICKNGVQEARTAVCRYEDWLQPLMMLQNILAVGVMQEITNDGLPVVQDDPQDYPMPFVFGYIGVYVVGMGMQTALRLVTHHVLYPARENGTRLVIVEVLFDNLALYLTYQGVYQTAILRGIAVWANKAANQAYPGFVVGG
mmetsp:Transcript_68586/g.191072  ORF Transcript_68586/g.191072 Transcript_68586/m.191072 type:complete len:358 (+) Transcript_68586:338-1411(+)